jgi:hypothetical protein
MATLLFVGVLGTGVGALLLSLGMSLGGRQQDHGAPTQNYLRSVTLPLTDKDKEARAKADPVREK